MSMRIVLLAFVVLPLLSPFVQAQDQTQVREEREMGEGKLQPCLLACIVAMMALFGSSAACAVDWSQLPAQPGQPAIYVTVIKASSPGKAPVALMMHGSGGINRYSLVSLQMWADWLSKRGFASVIIDSWRGRGIRGDDDIGNKYMTLTRGRIVDAERTVAWLSSTDWGDPSRALLYGESMGGSVGIFAATEQKMALPQVQIYPYCPTWMHASVHAKPGYPPSLWLIAEKDTIAPAAEAKRCGELINAASKSNPVNMVILPGAQHMFDRYPRDISYSGSAIEKSKAAIDAFLKSLALTQ
jgi:dienelactone hydrolase